MTTRRTPTSRKHSLQKGRLEFRGRRITLRYELRDPAALRGWVHRRETLAPGTSKRAAARYQKIRMAEVNQRNNGTQFFS